MPGCAGDQQGDDADAAVRDVLDQVSNVTAGENGLLTIGFFAFDTVIQIKAYGVDERVMQACKERCERFDALLSRQREGSDVWNVNHAGGKPVQVAPETAELVAASLAYCEASGGLFDITIGACTELWDFDEGVVPDPDKLARAAAHVDWRCVQVQGDTITLADEHAKLDVGGIAKGYIADDLAALLRAEGATGAFINLGGNVYVLGAKPDGSLWNVGLQDPNEATGTVFGKVGATDCSIVSSGLYERNFTAPDGSFYYHILDPKTGWPARTDLLASVIQCERSIDGDAYSTILFLQGARGALATLEDTPGFEGLVVDDAGKIEQSAGFCWEEL